MPEPQPPPAIDIDQLRELAKAATPAPWCQHPNGTSAWEGPDWDTVTYEKARGKQHRHVCNATSVDAAGIADIELIVAMRNSFEAMLQELAELRASTQKSKEERRKLRETLLAVHELAADRLADEGPGGDLAFAIEELTR